MRKLIIGRGIDSDVVIPDETDIVSRHHLVLSVGFWGKMTLCDTSVNGTFVNDKLIKKGEVVSITRTDKVRLGDSWILDWSQVKNPYHSLHILLVIISMILCLGLLGGGVWYFTSGNNRVTNHVAQEDTTLTDSVDTIRVIPAKDSSPRKKTFKKHKKTRKTITPKQKRLEPKKNEEKIEISDMPIVN